MAAVGCFVNEAVIGRGHVAACCLRPPLHKIRYTCLITALQAALDNHQATVLVRTGRCSLFHHHHLPSCWAWLEEDVAGRDMLLMVLAAMFHLLKSSVCRLCLKFLTSTAHGPLRLRSSSACSSCALCPCPGSNSKLDQVQLTTD